LKRTEQILVLIWITFLLLKGVDYTGGAAFFGLASFALGLFYLIGSFKLFEPQSNAPLIIPILAGLSLSTSLITIPFNIYLRNWDWLLILPFINIIFTTLILGLVVLKRIRKIPIEHYLKEILLRTFIVLLITSLFAFRPTENQLYRNTIIFLNAGNDDLISNMKMFDYWQESEKQLELGNCDKAIEYSLLSFKEGLKWLWIDGDSLTEKDLKPLWKIQATYTNIHKAYECKADKLYDSKNYKEALYYQFKADSFLNINPVAKNDSWKAERADSKNNIGIYYDALGQSDSAISYFSKAIIYYSDSIKTLNAKLATYFSNLSESLADSRYWKESNQAAEKSIIILKKDTLSDDKNDKFSISYLQLVYNALANNKPFKAKQYLEEVKPFLTPKWECRNLLYSTILANKLDKSIEALNKAREAIICYKNLYGEQHQNIAESHSLAFEAWMKIPNYDSALAHIRKGLEVTRLNHGLTTARYHDYVKREAYYYYSVGDYENSLKKLNEVRKVYEREFGRDSDKLPEVIATIGRIKIEQGEYGDAGKLATESLRLAEFHEFFIDDRASGLLNDIAYINYATNQNFVADTLYKKSIELNLEADQDSSLSVASALNGLGLLATRKSQFFEADSLFNQSLELYQHRTSDLHPDKGIVLMNLSELSFKRKNFSDALELINQALENFTPFHRDNHPTIADMYSSKAIILAMKDERTQAKELLIKAVEIYESNFQPEHSKIRETRNRLGAIDNSR
jgi:hypothetical protein